MNILFKSEVIDYNFYNNKKHATVIFLHGWGGNKNSFFNTIKLLKSKFNILTITIPTVDETSSIFDMYTLLQHALPRVPFS